MNILTFNLSFTKLSDKINIYAVDSFQRSYIWAFLFQ